MFEMLRNSTSATVATSGVYYAMRLLKHKDARLTDPEIWQPAFRREGLKPAAEALVVNIVADIETAEGIELPKLTREQADAYICTLSDISEEIRTREQGVLTPEVEARYKAALAEITHMGIGPR